MGEVKDHAVELFCWSINGSSGIGGLIFCNLRRARNVVCRVCRGGISFPLVLAAAITRRNSCRPCGRRRSRRNPWEMICEFRRVDFMLHLVVVHVERNFS